MAEGNVGELSVRLSLDSTDFNTPLASVDRRLKALGGELATIRNKGQEWGKSLEGLGQKQEVLGRTLSTQENKVNQLREAYERSVQEKGADAAATEKLAAKLNRAIAEYTRTETELNQVNAALAAQQAEIAHAESAWGRMESSLKSASGRLEKTGETLQNVGKNLTLGVTTPILGIGTGMILAANNTEDSAVRIRNTLGLTAGEAEKLTAISRGIYKNGFGESFEEVDTAVLQTKQNIRGLNDEDLGEITQKAIILSKTFDADVNEVTRAGNNLMKGFGIESSLAFDLMAKGAQNGLNFSNEMFDNISEYATLFGKMGYSAEEYFQLLSQGIEAGAYNLDYINDIMKEFQIRVKDGSKASRDAMAGLSDETNAVWKAFMKGEGTVKDVANAVLGELKGMDDQVKANEIGVGLFGTKFEDLEADAVYALGGIDGGLKDVEGSMDSMADNLEESFSQQWQSTLREAKSALVPLGEVMLDIAKDVIPPVSEAVTDLAEGFRDMSPEAKENAVLIGGLAAAAGPAIAGIGFLSTGLGSLAKMGSGLAGALGREGGKGLLGRLGLMGASAGPVGLAIVGVGALGLGIYELAKATKESEEVNLEHAETLIQQQQSLDGLIGKYEALAEKNKLSNDELLLFRDIQNDMDTATSAEELEELAAQAEALQKKSGLSNTELQTMLGLNDELIEKVPTAGQVFSDQGEAILKNSEDLNAANEKLRESIQLELELQKTKAEAQLGKDIQNRISAQEELNGKIRELNNEQITQAATEYQLSQLRNEQQNLYAQGQDVLAQGMDSQIMTLEAQVAGHEKNVGAIAGEVQEKQKSLGKTDEQIAKTQALYGDLINLQLASAGINGKGAEGLAQLDSAIIKSRDRVAQLEAARQKHGSLNAEQQKELDTLNSALGTYRSTKDEIINIQGEQGAVNQKIDEGTAKSGEMSSILSKSEIKDIKFTGDGYEDAQIITKEADKDVKKEVDVTDYGKANSIHDEAEKDAHKSIFVKVKQTVGGFIKGIGNILGFANGTDFHKGGLAWVGDGVGSNAGPELIETPDGKAFLSPAEPTLMDLPRGTSVKSATETRGIVGEVPRYANGTKAKKTTTKKAAPKKEVKPFELVNYDPRLKAVAEGSGVARVREIRQAEIDSLEAQIVVLTKEGATIKELSQAKEKEARLSKLQAEKSKEYQSRIKEQQITLSALTKAYKNKKITLSEYNTQVADVQAEIHKLTAEQLAHNDAMKNSFNLNESEQTKAREIRMSNMALLEKEIEHLSREGATQKELNQAKEKEDELNYLRSRKQKEYENRLKDQQKSTDSINNSYRKGLITREKYNTLITEATVEMNDLKMETLAFYEEMTSAQDEAAKAIREDLAQLMDDVASAQTEAFEKAMDKQLSDLSDKQRESVDLYKEETDAFVDELNRQKAAALDSFDAQTKAHEEAINRQIENINKRRDAELAAIDEQLAALEEKEKQEGREDVEAEWTKELANLERRFKVADFMQDENTMKEVAQEKAELEKTIAKQRKDWEREDLKESLKLEQDKINQSYDQQEEALKTELDRFKESRDAEKAALEERYELREQQYEAMRAQQLEALELEYENAMEAAEREYELQKDRFAALQEELVKHVENGTMTQQQANKAWAQAIKDAGIEQVYLEIENQEKSKEALNEYVEDYLAIGKSYGDNLVNGVVGQLNARLAEVQAAAARIREAMAINASLEASVASSTRAIARAVPAAVNNTQPIVINMDGEEIAAYSFNHATGAMRQVSRKG